MDLKEDSKLDELLNINITIYLKKVKSLMLQIIIKSIFYSSRILFIVKHEGDFFAGVSCSLTFFLYFPKS